MVTCVDFRLLAIPESSASQATMAEEKAHNCKFCFEIKKITHISDLCTLIYTTMLFVWYFTGILFGILFYLNFVVD